MYDRKQKRPATLQRPGSGCSKHHISSTPLFERAGLGLFTAQAVHNMTAESQGQNMKAVYIEHFGGPEVVKYGDLPDPVAGRGDIVVDIVNASVNAADWKVRNGQYKQAAFPLGLGRDFSGVVSAVGEGVETLKA